MSLPTLNIVASKMNWDKFLLDLIVLTLYFVLLDPLMALQHWQLGFMAAPYLAIICLFFLFTATVLSFITVAF